MHFFTSEIRSHSTSASKDQCQQHRVTFFFFLHRIPFCLYHLYLNFIAIENYALSSLFLYPFSRSQYVIHEARAHGSQKLWLALYPFPHSWNNSQVSSISVRNTFSTSCPTSLKRLPTTISKSKRRKKIDLPVTMASGLYVQPAGSRGQRSDYVVKWSLHFITVNVFHFWSTLMSVSFMFLPLLSKQFISKFYNALLSTLALFQEFDKYFLIYF